MPDAASVVRAQSLLTPGLRAEMAGTYRRQYKAQDALMGQVMRLDLTSNKRFEIYAYPKSAPYPARWDRGTDIPTKAFDTVQFTVPNFRYGRRIQWNRDDEADDLTNSLFTQAREAGTAFATLNERIFFQILQSTADPDLLPAIPNAPDGAALASAVDGDGADRFGVVGGNVLAGVANPTSQDIRDIYHDALERYTRFLDTEGQPLIDAGTIAAGLMIIYGPSLTQEMREAFQQKYVLQTTTAPAALAAAPTNVIVDAGDGVKLWRSPRITNKSIYFVLTAIELKPIFLQKREPLAEVPATLNNSDFTRDTMIEYLQWSLRNGYGIALPYGLIKATN